jgi:hypothetical protein
MFSMRRLLAQNCNRQVFLYAQAAMYGTTTMAAPAYGAGYAAPSTYGAGYAAPATYGTGYAAPMATTAYAAPAAYAPATTAYAAPAYNTAYAAPATTSYAAPAYSTYAAPQVTTQAPSYVAAPVAMPQMVAMPQAAPQMVAMPQGIMPPALPVTPIRLTEGIPTPEQIDAQKRGYGAALDKQLKEATDTVVKETAIEKEMVKFNAAKQIALFENQVEEKLIESLSAEDERATFALLELKKALVERNLQLSSQAENLTMDYQLKAVQTEWAQKKYAFEQQYLQQERGLEQKFAQQQAIANTGTTYAAPAQAVR